MRRAVLFLSTASATAMLVASAVIPARAHHAFGAEFDPNRPLRLEGRVVRLEWVNPHSWIHIEVDACSGSITVCADPDGTKHVWMVEGGTPNTLLRRGLSRDLLMMRNPDGTTTGAQLIVDGYQAKDHSLRRANGRDITFPDGRKMFMGSSGTGAPRDGADPTERR